MSISSKAFLTFILFCFSSIILPSFKLPAFDCSSVKNGTFHFYKNNDQYHSVVVRKDSLQTEINLNTGDTTYWHIAWTTDCEFTCKYISGSKAKSQQELDFYKQSTLKFTIIAATKEYYTYDALLTYNNASKRFSDTMWLHEK